MEPKFWHERWENNNIGFHASAPNPMLVKHLDSFKLNPKSRILIPLCGKSLDISWLISLGYSVVGIELSRIAIDQLFSEMKIYPVVENLGSGVFKFSAESIDIFVGDIFDVSKEMVGAVDAVYDRAALVALPEDLRIKYAAHVSRISGKTKTLLITYEYDQGKFDGPPFSVVSDEVNRLYNNDYKMIELNRSDVPEGLRGNSAQEVVWLIS